MRALRIYSTYVGVVCGLQVVVCSMKLCNLHSGILLKCTTGLARFNCTLLCEGNGI